MKRRLERSSINSIKYKYQTNVQRQDQETLNVDS
jgi:hypothetical protein